MHVSQLAPHKKLHDLATFLDRGGQFVTLFHTRYPLLDTMYPLKRGQKIRSREFWCDKAIDNTGLIIKSGNYHPGRWRHISVVVIKSEDINQLNCFLGIRSCHALHDTYERGLGYYEATADALERAYASVKKHAMQHNTTCDFTIARCGTWDDDLNTYVFNMKHIYVQIREVISILGLDCDQVGVRNIINWKTRDLTARSQVIIPSPSNLESRLEELIHAYSNTTQVKS